MVKPAMKRFVSRVDDGGKVPMTRIFKPAGYCERLVEVAVEVAVEVVMSIV